MTQLQRRAFDPGVALHPLGAYSQAMEFRPGRLLYIAGQVGLDATFSNVVEFTTYLVGTESIQPFMDARSQIFPGLFPDDQYPPITLLLVAGLVREELLVEIKAVAALP